MASRQGWTFRDARSSRDARHLEMPLTSRMLGAWLDIRTKGNRYKNGLDFIITLVIVNSYKFFSYID